MTRPRMELRSTGLLVNTLTIIYIYIFPSHKPSYIYSHILYILYIIPYIYIYIYIPISQTIQIRWVRHAGHCWRSKEELSAMVLSWTPQLGCDSWPTSKDTKTSIHQFCPGTGCILGKAKDDWNRRWERIRKLCSQCNLMTIYIYIYICSPTHVGLSSLAREVMVATIVKQGSSNVLRSR